uniref:Uncharacterized protein n=1 Tax=Panagrolaimus sp. PS1159 TaxID=55785 RepID=A0AC35F7Z9_9BILA
MRQFIFLIVFIAVVIAADNSSQESAEKKEEEGSSFTTKVPIESVAVAKKKVGEDKAKVATATKLKEKNVEGSPSEANLPTISIPETTTTKSIKLAKVPTEEIAVAHKKLGEETKVATATKSSIVAIEENNEEKKDRARRNANSSESSEDLKETAVDILKNGDKKQAHGPSESDMAAGDPVKLEAKPMTRARRFA